MVIATVMAQSYKLNILVAALLISTLSCCSAENVYCVTPTATTCSSCPHNSTNCTTLSEYAQESELYFTSNTTMVFLPGDHTLDTNITVANVARLILHGESSSSNRATVVSSGSVGLNFTNMVDFNIHSLAFTSFSTYVLQLQSTECAELVNCSFHDNMATALVVNNTNITLSGNTEFTHNQELCGNIVAGGGISASDSNLTFTGNTTFLDNSANIECIFLGSAIYTSGNTALIFNGASNFINNSAGSGGAIHTSGNTALIFNGTSNFINNSAAVDGGAIYTSYNTVLNLYGTINFINNSAAVDGGAISTSGRTVLSCSGTSNFINNSAENIGGGRGGAISTSNAVLSFNGTNNFINNSASYDGGVGGAIYASYNAVLSFSGTNNFINNSADNGGGAIFTYSNTALSFNGISNFINNSAPYYDGIVHVFTSIKGCNGGAISTSYNVTLSFNGTSNFINNSADYNGGAISTSYNTVLSFNGMSNFINNSADYTGGAISKSENAVLSFNGTSSFINNSAGTDGGAIFLRINTTMTFNGTINFTNNVCKREIELNGRAGAHGGGLHLGLKSTLFILPNTIVYWVNNHATLGGAIYVEDASPYSYCTSIVAYIAKEDCFFQLPGQNMSNGLDVQLVFTNNSADVAGSVLFGGVIDNCKLTHGLDPYSSGEVFDMLVHIDNDTEDNTTSTISSDPLQICPCHHSFPDCKSWYYFRRAVYPGETFQISVAAVGQRNGTVPGRVRSTIDNPNINLQEDQYLQQANHKCTKLNYTMFYSYLFQFQSKQMDLYPEDSPCPNFDYQRLVISVLFAYETCPPGFNISELAGSCVCDPRLAQYTQECTITNGVGQITRKSGQQFWVGFWGEYYDIPHGIILHPWCPFDYCVSHKVVFSLDDTDMQCAYNRSGLLCGACKEGHSLVLGTSHCKRCTNSNLVLLVPFAVMGITLVFLLFVCKLTVATGTLSGLVFYANIVGANRTIFLPVESTNPLLSVFIAWLNLDFGIETCFYDGMDAYSKTWLQFVFPVYIWMLVGLMILVSNCSHRFSKLLGNNPVSVLATLILLSYTKILRTLIAVFYITYLEYPMYNRGVWLFDANVDSTSGKYIALIVVSVLVFLFLFLPYTLLLLFGQWLQAISHLRLFSWVNSARLKPFMDSYHAPYKGKHHYWPGLLLVLRFVLLLVFAFEFNPHQDPSVNLLAILVGTGLLVAWAWISGGVYRNWCLDALESSFALNLIILVGATSYAHHSGGNQLAVGYTSVSIALATFIGILVFQLANVTGITQYLKRKWTAIGNLTEERSPTGSLPDRLINPAEYDPSLHTPQGHATVEPAEGANEAQRRLIPAYTYGAIN